jgi:Flp pilus assembly protein TadD
VVASCFALVLLGLGACQTTDLPDITGSLGDKAEQDRPSDPRADLALYRERFRNNPGDPDIALGYGSALRATGQRAQAVAVLEQATLANPNNTMLLAGYGRALADNGNFQQAFDVLGRAHSPEDPDWRILSVQGAVLDQLGRHDEARQYYGQALKMVPDEPSVLSNLGLSYLLTNDLPKAEEILRKAYGQAEGNPRVRANLAIVLGLEGRTGEAESIMKAGLPPDQAAANVAYLKRLLARKQTAQNDAAPKARLAGAPMASAPDKTLAKLLSRSDD